MSFIVDRVVGAARNKDADMAGLVPLLGMGMVNGAVKGAPGTLA